MRPYFLDVFSTRRSVVVAVREQPLQHAAICFRDEAGEETRRHGPRCRSERALGGADVGDTSARWRHAGWIYTASPLTVNPNRP
jgi:hypothetical protein